MTSSSRAAKPRVLLLTPYFSPVVGGVEAHARDFAAHLQRHGVAVTVLTKRLGSLPSRDVVDGVPVQRIGPRGAPSPSAKWRMLPSTAWALARLRGAYDVIYCPDPRAVGLAAAAVGRLTSRPLVIEPAAPGTLSCSSWDTALSGRGIAPDGLVARVMKWLPRRAYAAAHGVACLSAEIESEARAIGVPAARVARIRHGVDLERYRPARDDEAVEIRRRLKLPDAQRLVVYLGRLSREKGILDLLEAWRLLGPADAHLLLVGPASPGHPLDISTEARGFVGQHGLGSQVTFYGPTDNPSEILRAADVFAHPSHYEAFGISVAEAMASGVPVLATNIAGFADYLSDGVNALLAPPGAPRELATRLRRLLDDAALRATLGAAGRRTAESLFDAEQALGTLLDFICRSVKAA